MEEQPNRLQDILEEEIAIHAALKQDLQLERVQDGRIDGMTLLKLQEEKNRKFHHIQVKEIERMGLVREIAADWGEDPENLTLSQIIPRVAPRLGEQLRDCHGRLIDLVNDIRDLAKITSSNAQARLKAIDATLAVINEAVKMHPTYSEEGRLETMTPTFKHTSA